MPDDLAQRATPALHLRAAFEPATWNAEARTIDVIWTTGADVTRTDYWTGQRWIERLDVTPDAVDLGRMNAGAPVLNTHSSYSLGDVVGVVERAWVENGRGMATLRFSDRPEVGSIIRDVAAGILRNISVGYVVEKWDVTDASKSAAEVRTARRWTPYEVSLVPIPADAGAQVRASSPETAAQVRAVQPYTPAAPAAPKESNMPDIDPAADAAARTAELDAVRAAERARVADIMTTQRQAGLDAEWGERHIAAGTAIDAARAEALAEIAKRGSPRIPPQVAGAHQDAGETNVRLLTNALEHRAGVAGVKLEDGARQYRGFRMLDFARESIEMSGEKSRGLSPMETFARASQVHQRNRMMQRDGGGGLASGDFPYLLANTASKMLRQGYEMAPRTFVPWCRQVNLPDFKSFDAVALSGAPALAVMSESAEVTYGSISDAKETWNLARYARALRISYVAMVNDDLSGFTRIPQMWGNSVARLESETVYAILTANAAMADAVTLFHSTHGNSATGVLSADATGVASVAAAVGKLRVQTAPNGDILGLTARYLIVPAAKEAVAMQLFAAANVINTLGAVNPYRASMEVISEPRLDATSGVQFYVAGDPNQIDTIHYGYLDGQEGPEVSTDIDFDTDGMATKVTHNFGAKAVDWRGLVYSSGA